jgi:1-acyl-sn-glycerol-3-phosphate acyltransferase
VLVLFPEGERSIDGDPKAFRKGAAILSHHLQAPMVPAAIDGAFTIWPRNQAFNWRALLPWSGTRARIAFGPPVQAAGADYAAQTSVLREAIVGMWDTVHAERAARGSMGASTETQ